MTSVAFIALIGLGAGSEVRHATGVTVFAGMLGVTLFGLFLTPVFYVGLRRLGRRPWEVVRRLSAESEGGTKLGSPTFVRPFMASEPVVSVRSRSSAPRGANAFG